MSKVVTRLYCHGLGDCNLLGFDVPDRPHKYWILIDCGIHTSVKAGNDTIDAIVADIAATVKREGSDKPRLDVVVATHEHWDHISGFLTAAEHFGQMEIGEVWLGWTENPQDDLARSLDRYKGQALAALSTASMRLAPEDPEKPSPLSKGIDALLGFQFGAKGERSRAARDALVAMAPNKVRYLEPQEAFPLPLGIGVKVYVLGPPRDLAMLGIRDSAADTYGIDNGWPMAAALRGAFALADGDYDQNDDVASPFGESEGVPLSSLDTTTAEPGSIAAFARDHYLGALPEEFLPEVLRGTAHVDGEDRPSTQQAWRQIGGFDWLGTAADLALQLDNRTNNTSLVLAFALDAPKNPGGNVLLFAADAQVGNWMSWAKLKFDDDVTGPELMKRTVLYKVGHHGSSNATLRGDENGGGGLEAMLNPALTAFIPTDGKGAENVGWHAMPAPELLTRLQERTRGRVVRADGPSVDPEAKQPDDHLRIQIANGVRYWEAEWDGGVKPRRTRRRRI